MANLYQIRSEIENFAAEVDEETGEFLNAEAWDALNMAFEEKVENTACYVKNLRADILAFKAEEDALAQRRKQLEKKVEFLEKLLHDSLNGQKFQTAKCAISFRRSTSVDVMDMGLLPEHLLTIKTSTTANKTAIARLLKEGVAVPGCVLSENLNIGIK